MEKRFDLSSVVVLLSTPNCWTNQSTGEGFNDERLFLSLTTLALLFGSEEQVQADIIINFDGLAQNDAGIHDLGPVYSADGFTLTASTSDPIANPPSLVYLGLQSPFSLGRTALYQHISGGEISLTQTDGGAFNFNSIDLAELPAGDTSGNPVNSGPFNFTFYGIKADGSTVSDTVTINSFLTLATYDLTGLNNVVDVYWFQGAGPPASPTHQFDNLEVSPVPEPSTITLLGTAGIMGLGYFGSRRRKLAACFFFFGALRHDSTLSGRSAKKESHRSNPRGAQSGKDSRRAN